MRLKNRKTGEIIEENNYCFQILKPSEPFYNCNTYDEVKRYESVKELNEEWEDYQPAEPLIKDEKIRKIVRAWYDNFRDERLDDKITFCHEKVGSLFRIDVLYDHDLQGCAELNLLFDSSRLKDGKEYTLAELCGEEE